MRRRLPAGAAAVPRWMARIVRGALLVCLLGMLASGCRRGGGASAGAVPGETVHTARGLIRELPATGAVVVIRHEPIPGFMPKMTMSLNVGDTNELRGMAVGDEVMFRLHTTEGGHWIDGLRRIGRGEVLQMPVSDVVEAPELQVGDPMPDVGFRDESGREVRLSAFKGRAVALTFIFTRCPLPEYCPRMSAHFAKARALLAGRAGGPSNWQFISLSFDPEFDTPEVLARHAGHVRGGSADRWLFGVLDAATLSMLAPRVDLRLQREGGSIGHNLRTVVIDVAGRVSRQLDGNAWTPGELAEAVVAAGNPESP